MLHGRPIPGVVQRGAVRRGAGSSRGGILLARLNGRTSVASFLLDQGVDPSGGAGTGMNAFHWAVNRGQSEIIDMLLRRGVPLETKNSYGGTVLGAAVWAAIHEPKPQHPAIIEALLRAGADIAGAGYPTGDAGVDEVLRRHGAG